MKYNEAKEIRYINSALATAKDSIEHNEPILGILDTLIDRLEEKRIAKLRNIKNRIGIAKKQILELFQCKKISVYAKDVQLDSLYYSLKLRDEISLITVEEEIKDPDSLMYKHKDCTDPDVF